MFKILPFVLIPLLILGGLGYFRFVYLPQQNLENPVKSVSQQTGPIEVPKSLPGATVDDRVNTLEQSIATLIKEINSLKSPGAQSTVADAARLNNAESAIVELKARVSALEKTTPTPVISSSKSTVYIPLGSGGQINGNTDWNNLNTFQATVDPAQYPGYTSMQLEVNMRLNQPGGTLYARLYSGGSLDSSQVTTTSTSSSLVTSGTFTVSGSKTYTLQAKSSDGTQAFIDDARIKVNF